ncbi:hypothetical protein ACWGMA_18965 [Streptomyces asiaticus]
MSWWQLVGVSLVCALVLVVLFAGVIVGGLLTVLGYGAVVGGVSVVVDVVR